MRIRLIIHERIGRWAAQIRSRTVDLRVRLQETRSAEDLDSAASSSVCPIILISVENRPRVSLEHLHRARLIAPKALILVVNAPELPEFATIARELGATHVLPRPALPPEVMFWIHRWLPLARQRTEASGWSEERRPEPEPWEALLAIPS